MLGFGINFEDQLLVKFSYEVNTSLGRLLLLTDNNEVLVKWDHNFRFPSYFLLLNFIVGTGFILLVLLH